ncbi:hypothetical protein [Pseudomonas sp. AN-1]|uniref:hypothetical protein n=1 Tax=Pseudomonas sp. AN-1 TaxID=3096605 RepID=UPI002A6AE524|nr:hypothetical protein [Pseudomonas sp. AN-1]WPP47479.1 hypothetical protein SK095_08930 [Pseudomonas sp. AN-1]
MNAFAEAHLSGMFASVFERRVDHRNAWRPQPEPLAPRLLATPMEEMLALAASTASAEAA